MDKNELLSMLPILVGGMLVETNFILDRRIKIKSRKETKDELQKIKEQFIPKDKDYQKYNFPIIKYAILNKEENEKLLDMSKKLEEKPKIYQFYQKLSQEIKIDHLTNFLTNAQTVTVSNEKLTMTKRIIEIENGLIKFAEYNPNKNEITIYHNFVKSAINHELLHLASFNSCTQQVGLSYYDHEENKILIGKGITEGYTELLNRRYFNSKNLSYPKLKKIAELIELFYEDKKDMEADFFHANFYNLLAHLTQSISYDEAINMLIDTDYILYHPHDNKHFKNIKENMYSLYSQNHSKSEKETFKVKAKLK